MEKLFNTDLLFLLLFAAKSHKNPKLLCSSDIVNYETANIDNGLQLVSV